MRDRVIGNLAVSYAAAPGSSPGFAPNLMSSDGPKSFKDMQFPPPRDGISVSVYAPLPPAPQPRSLSKSEVDKRAAQLLEMKARVNAARCPLCSGQLDGHIGFDLAKVYCAAYTNKEYSATYSYWIPEPQYSIATIYTTHMAYEVIHQHLEKTRYLNSIYQIDLSLSPKYQQSQKKLFTSFEGSRFFLSKKLNEKQLLEKIKLYTVFS